MFYPELYQYLPWVRDRPVSKDGPAMHDCPVSETLAMVPSGGIDQIFQWDRLEAEQEIIDLVRTYAMPWFEKYSDPLMCSRSEFAVNGKRRKLFTDLAKRRAKEADDIEIARLTT
jgi:hypothetical protein